MRRRRWPWVALIGLTALLVFVWWFTGISIPTLIADPPEPANQTHSTPPSDLSQPPATSINDAAIPDDSEPPVNSQTGEPREIGYFNTPASLARWSEHLKAARAGDADAIHELELIAERCGEAPEDADSVEQRIGEFAEPVLADELIHYYRELRRVCTDIMSTYRGEEPTTWRKQRKKFGRQALEAGSVLAQIRRATRYGDREATHADVANWLEEAVKEGGFRAFYYADDFYTRVHRPEGRDVNQLMADKWHFAGCQRDPNCQQSVLLRNLEATYPAWALAEIQAFPEEVNRKLTSGSTMGFASSWMPLEGRIDRSGSVMETHDPLSLANLHRLNLAEREAIQRLSHAMQSQQPGRR